MSLNRYELNPLQLDMLKEITNIGAGNAATALADILADRVVMSVPDLQITGVGQVANVLGGPEKEVAGVLLAIEGDIEGMLMFILEKKLIHTLLGVLLNKEISDWTQIDDMDMSMFKEIGNIIAGAYVNALAEMSNMTIHISPPEIAIDMVGAILNYPAAVFGAIGDTVLFVKEDFDSGDYQVSCHLLIIPLPESLQLILKRLGGENG